MSRAKTWDGRRRRWRRQPEGPARAARDLPRRRGQLHLDLPEALDRARPAQHLHGASTTSATGPSRRGPTRPDVATAAGHRRQRRAARQTVTRSTTGQVGPLPPGRAPRGTAPPARSCRGQLELESRFALGSLSCHSSFRLDAAAEGDTRHRQPMVRGQVDVGECPRGQRLSRQSGRRNRARRRASAALERGLHPLGRRAAHGHGAHTIPRPSGRRRALRPVCRSRVATVAVHDGNAANATSNALAPIAEELAASACRATARVHLVLRPRLPIVRAHDPVADDWRAPERRDRTPAADSGRARSAGSSPPHLAERALLFVLARLELPLGRDQSSWPGRWISSTSTSPRSLRRE